MNDRTLLNTSRQMLSRGPGSGWATNSHGQVRVGGSPIVVVKGGWVGHLQTCQKRVGGSRTIMSKGGWVNKFYEYARSCWQGGPRTPNLKVGENRNLSFLRRTLGFNRNTKK